MADRVYPSNKPAAAPAAPAPKSNFFNPARHPFRPPPNPRGRSCSCCRIFIYLAIFILGLVFAVAIGGVVFYIIYHPHRPSFAISSLRFTSFNLSSSSSNPRLLSRLDISISARNANKRLALFYDPSSLTVSSSGADIGSGTLPSFSHFAKSSTTLKSSVATGTSPLGLDPSAATAIRSSIKNSNRLPIRIRFQTKVGVKIGSLKTSKVSIKVFCDEIQASIPRRKSPASAFSGNGKCSVKLRMKIWKWQL